MVRAGRETILMHGTVSLLHHSGRICCSIVLAAVIFVTPIVYQSTWPLLPSPIGSILFHSLCELLSKLFAARLQLMLYKLTVNTDEV